MVKPFVWIMELTHCLSQTSVILYGRTSLEEAVDHVVFASGVGLLKNEMLGMGIRVRLGPD